MRVNYPARAPDTRLRRAKWRRGDPRILEAASSLTGRQLITTRVWNVSSSTDDILQVSFYLSFFLYLFLQSAKQENPFSSRSFNTSIARHRREPDARTALALTPSTFASALCHLFRCMYVYLRSRHKRVSSIKEKTEKKKKIARILYTDEIVGTHNVTRDAFAFTSCS